MITLEELITKLEEAIKQVSADKDKAQATVKEQETQFVYLSGMLEGYQRVLNTIKPPAVVDAEASEPEKK